jgi:N-acetylglucosamine kinase-like BadF-type ATPase
MRLYVGVDGGGSKTQVFVLDLDNLRGISCVGEASNPNSVGWDTASATVEHLIVRCLEEIESSIQDIKAISLCMAGVDRPEQIHALRDRILALFPCVKLEITNDALAVLTAGIGGESGTVLIAGTGSIAVGESTNGSMARAGGYGYLIGDEGSGFAIGRAGIMAAIQSTEGRGEKTALAERAIEFFQLHQTADLIAKVYGSSHPVGTVASFAREVVACAKASDTVARRIIADAVDHYILLIQSVHQQLNYEISNKVVLSGGLFTNTDVLPNALQERMPNWQFITPKTSAALGAALRALALEDRQLLDGLMTQEVIETMTATENG